MLEQILGCVLIFFVSLIGFRYLVYYKSFFFHWRRYRQTNKIATWQLAKMPVPFIKIQITTRGSYGSTPVIRRGIQNILDLVYESPYFYGRFMCIEIVTESEEQERFFEHLYHKEPIQVSTIVMPPHYQTPKGTGLKARGLHYMVEMRRSGFNYRNGKTFIVHYDEESVIRPNELRKLIYYLTTTKKRLVEGPIYYPLEYRDTSLLCRAMEANRPVGCFECREVMERGVPIHMHGSNLVIDEALENDLGWDIGRLGDQPFIAEDYVFGMLAFIKYGNRIFGWHGVVMLEQPPFSTKSAFRQRYRWIIGVLQGIAMMKQMEEFYQIPYLSRTRILLGTRYRIITFACGVFAGACSFLYMFFQIYLFTTRHGLLILPVPLMVWMIAVGFLWLNSILIGGWYNVRYSSEMPFHAKYVEVLKIIAIAPVAGIVESSAAFWAVASWAMGKRTVSWTPTPKTKKADVHS